MNSGSSVLYKIIGFIVEGAVKYSFQVMGGIVILIASWMLSRFVAGLIHRSLAQKKVDITIVKFIAQAVRVIILAFGILMTLSSFGVQIAPLIAGLSVAGLGAGLALQGPLSNYTAGATLIFTKPFKVGDIIEVKDMKGEVLDITLPRTELLGLDGSRIVIPNKHIIGEVIRNYAGYRQLQVAVGVSYDSDVAKAIKIIDNIIKLDQRVATERPVKVGIKEFGDSSINLVAYAWVPQAYFGEVQFDVNARILEIFRAENINIPFPQMDIQVTQKLV